MTKKVDDFQKDPLWYKDAIIYEIRVRSFCDSNGDGIGDFKGLTEKLDYLQELGINTIWLLPFYPSPLRDDGYDISDYNNIHPDCGSLQDFRNFMREVRKRGIRVISELIINHTSDQHPWFRKSRKVPVDKKWRDFYVWSDNVQKYKHARIIFKDFEPSNWSWDPVAKAYYWHRFFAHQPDLNFDNPAVHRAVNQCLDFWLGMGVDGVRLDAIPYLYERDGTNCENLPETHEYLKKMRRHMDRKWKNKMFLAEANQWPEDAVQYFGKGDECQMAFHFPIMPRLFMAIHMEDRTPIIDILEQTPEIPDSCQWALFLRNHDELTLEMVTDEERDYMNRVYASEPQARINLGIRRRLAPLLGNNRRKIELMNGLLFSLPGSPVLYYGDEIGMGDNIYLGDRNGVRTPMQWSGDRNAGFSRANPQKLFLPIITDPEYHFETVNVESQQNNPHSLFWWMKRLIALRKRYKAFGRGTIKFLTPSNSKVLAYIREYEGDKILVVANLSRFVQYVELDLATYKGMYPVELFGQIEFPSIGDLPYFVTLGPHGFYWFSLTSRKQDALESLTSEKEVPTFSVKGRWENVFEDQTKSQLEAAIPNYFMKQRWFGGKAKKIKAAHIVDVIPFSNGEVESCFTLVKIDYNDGHPEIYTAPFAYAKGKRKDQIVEGFPKTILANIHLDAKQKEEGILYDAVIEPGFSSFLLSSISKRRQIKGLSGKIIAQPTKIFRDLIKSAKGVLTPTGIHAEQSNSSTIFGDKLILKLFRRMEDGINPDLEIGNFLSQAPQALNSPRIAGHLEYSNGNKAEPSTIAILHGFVLNQGDAWKYTLDELDRYYERTASMAMQGEGNEFPSENILDLSEKTPPEALAETVGPYLESARILGQRTAELHMALGSDTDNPHFTHEPFTPFTQRSLYQSFRDQTIRTFGLLRKSINSMPEESRKEAQVVLKNEEKILSFFQDIRKKDISTMQIRCHGDFHLGQVLYTGKDFVIIDFEGEPARSLNDRKRKRSPLRDVAGMIRSFYYAVYVGLEDQRAKGRLSDVNPGQQEQWALFWYKWVCATYLKSYFGHIKKAPFIPASKKEIEFLLNIFILDKAVYELGYELNNRPDWIKVPLKGILQLLETIK